MSQLYKKALTLHFKTNISKFFLLKIIFLNIITFNYIRSEDRAYLYKYSKLYNSYKFDTTKPEYTDTDIDPKNCLEIQATKSNGPEYSDFAKCGINLIDEATYKLNVAKDLALPNTDWMSKFCLPGYKTLKGSYIACNYQQKSRLVAVLLETLGLGFGHLYIGKYLFFFAKFLSCLLFCYMIVCVIFFVGAINGSNVSDETSKSSTKIVKFIFPIIYVLYFFDIICFAGGFYTDENEQDLY